MPVAATLNQVVQIGQEASLGAGGTAGHVLKGLRIDPKAELMTKAFTPQARRFVSVVEPEKQWTTFPLAGDALYSEILYALEAIFGTVTATTLGTLTKRRVYTPALTGAIVPKSFTLQWGDAVNVNSFNYGILSDIGMDYKRDAVTLTGAGLGQLSAPGATFTASPVSLANVPILGSHLNYYLDATAAALGTTQMTNTVIDSDWSYKGANEAYFDSNRANTSFSTHVDKQPTALASITLIENATTRAIDLSMTPGVTQFFRIDCQGAATETGQVYMHQVDLALKLLSKDPWADNSGVYARKFNFQIVEDAIWGKAFSIASQTLEATL